MSIRKAFTPKATNFRILFFVQKTKIIDNKDIFTVVHSIKGKLTLTLKKSFFILLSGLSILWYSMYCLSLVLYYLPIMYHSNRKASSLSQFMKIETEVIDKFFENSNSSFYQKFKIVNDFCHRNFNDFCKDRRSSTKRSS